MHRNHGWLHKEKGTDSGFRNSRKRIGKRIVIALDILTSDKWDYSPVLCDGDPGFIKGKVPEITDPMV